MGIVEVAQILKEFKKAEPHRWVSAKEVKRELGKMGLGGGAKARVYDNLYSLVATKEAKAKLEGFWKNRVLFQSI